MRQRESKDCVPRSVERATQNERSISRDRRRKETRMVVGRQYQSFIIPRARNYRGTEWPLVKARDPCDIWRTTNMMESTFIGVPRDPSICSTLFLFFFFFLLTCRISRREIVQGCPRPNQLFDRFKVWKLIVI